MRFQPLDSWANFVPPSLVARKVEGNCCWVHHSDPGEDGYCRVTHQRKTHLAHRLAYEVYVGEIPEGMWIGHICGVPTCFRPDHLKLMTPEEVRELSMRRLANTGARVIGMGGEGNPNAKLSARKVRDIYRSYWVDTMRTSEIARKYSVSQQTVASIAHGRSWNSVTGHPKHTDNFERRGRRLRPRTVEVDEDDGD